MRTAALDPIDWSAPIDWSHPTNKGCKAWFLDTGRPGWRGGKSWRDLVTQRAATLTNDTSWGGNSHPGGLGQIVFGGVNSYAAFNGLASVSGTAVTVSAWIWATLYNGGGFVFFGTNTGAANYWEVFNDTQVYVGGGFCGIAATPFADGKWRHLITTSSAAASKVYVNGILVGSGGTPMTAMAAGPHDFYFGDWIGGAGGTYRLQGGMNDLRVFDRTFTDTDAWTLYDQSRRGYPDGLRRLKRSRTYVDLGAGGPAGSIGTGTATFGSLTANGSANFTVAAGSTGTGSLTFGNLSATGSATSTSAGGSTGSGSITLSDLTGSGSGTFVVAGGASGSGSLTFGNLAATGSATFTAAAGSTGTGSVTLGNLVTTGTGVYTSAGGASGSGSITLGALTPAGSATFTTAAGSSGSGSVTFSALTATGTAAFTAAGSFSGSGSVTFSVLTATGTGTFTAAAGAIATGTATFSQLSAVGFGSYTTISGTAASGSAVIGSMAVTGSATFTPPGGTVGTGSVSLSALTVSGVGILGFPGVGVISYAPFSVSGSALVAGAFSTVGSGMATFGSLVVIGTALGGALPNLIQAIKERVESIPELVAALPGGFWTGPPDEDADDNPPYAVLTWIGGRTISYVTQQNTPDDPFGGPVKAGKEDVFQITLVGYDFDVLDQIHDLWEDHFNPRMHPLQVRLKLFRKLFNEEPAADFGGSVESPSGQDFTLYRWDFSVISNTRET